MPSIKDLWPDKWLRPEHLQGRRPTVTIQLVALEQLFNPRTKRHEKKIVLSFYQKEKRLPLNKTQAEALARITRTEDYTEWVGHQVMIHEDIAPNGSPTITIAPLPDPNGGAHA